MLPLLIDQDFDHDILRGLRLRLPEIDAVTTLQAGLDRTPDPEVLAWAAEQGRVIVTHDRNTMPGHAYERLKNDEPIAGVFVVPRELPIGQAIAQLETLVSCSLAGEWNNLVLFLPH